MKGEKILADKKLLYEINPLFIYEIGKDGLIIKRTVSAKMLEHQGGVKPKMIAIFDESGCFDRLFLYHETFWQIKTGKERIYSENGNEAEVTEKIKEYYEQRAQDLEQKAAAMRKMADSIRISSQ